MWEFGSSHINAFWRDFFLYFKRWWNLRQYFHFLYHLKKMHCSSTFLIRLKNWRTVISCIYLRIGRWRKYLLRLKRKPLLNIYWIKKILVKTLCCVATSSGAAICTTATQFKLKRWCSLATRGRLNIQTRDDATAFKSLENPWRSYYTRRRRVRRAAPLCRYVSAAAAPLSPSAPPPPFTSRLTPKRNGRGNV